MKISAGRAERFVQRPDPKVRAVLVYGPDHGLARERAEALARGVVEDLSDPFRVTEMTGAALAADPARLADEAAALSLTGGARVVRVRGAGNDLAKLFAGFLDRDSEGALVVVEAGDLAKSSALRAAFEKAENGAALPCYADDPEALEEVVRGALSAHGLTAEHDAMAYLLENLGGDRGVTRAELDKLALYMGERTRISEADAAACVGDSAQIGLENLGGDRGVTRAELDKLALYMGERTRISEADAAACVGDSAQIGLDNLTFAAGGGDHAGAARALSRLALDGVAPVAALRALLRHLQRLHLVAGQAAQGGRVEQAVASLRPPVYFKRLDGFRAQARAWRPAHLVTAMDLINEAELDCKTTGLPAAPIAARAVMRVTEAARRAR